MATKKKESTKLKAKTVSKETSASDKRNTGNRVPIQLLVDYHTDGHYLFDFCRDLGTGGVFIETETPIAQGSKMELTFTIPDSKETLDATGTVIWVQNPVPGREDLTPGMGVQFDQFNTEQRKILEDFVIRYHGADFIGKKPA